MAIIRLRSCSIEFVLCGLAFNAIAWLVGWAAVWLAERIGAL